MALFPNPTRRAIPSRLSPPAVSSLVAGSALPRRERRTSAAASSCTAGDVLEPRILLSGADGDDQFIEATFAGGITTSGITHATSIDSGTDVSMFRFVGKAGQTVEIEVMAERLGTPSNLDSMLSLFDDAGNLLAFGTGDESTEDAFLAYTFSTTDTYYVGLSSHGNVGYDPITGGGDRNGNSTGEAQVTFRQGNLPVFAWRNAAGELWIYGTAHADDIAITNSSQLGQFTLESNGGTISVAERGQSFRTLAFANITGSVNFLGDRGDDVLRVDNVNLPGMLHFNGGWPNYMTNTGNDRLEVIGSDFGDFLEGGLVVEAGDGDDVVYLLNATVNGGSSISTGEGRDAIRIERTDLSDSISIDDEAGASDVVFLSVKATGDFELSAGAGRHWIAVVDTSISGSFSVDVGDGGRNDLHLIRSGVGGYFDYFGDADHDEIVLEGAFIVEDASINLRDGSSNYVGVQSTEFYGYFAVQGGEGSDEVSLSDIGVSNGVIVELNDGNNRTVMTRVFTAPGIFVSGGAGGDEVILLGAHTARNVMLSLAGGLNRGIIESSMIEGSVLMHGGFARDEFAILYSQVIGHAAITDFGGQSHTRIVHARIGRDLTITASDAEQTVLLADNSVGRSLRISSTGGVVNTDIVRTVVGRDFSIDSFGIPLHVPSNDFVFIAEVTVGGSATVELGDGDNEFRLRRITTGADLRLVADDGFDLVRLIDAVIGDELDLDLGTGGEDVFRN